MSAYSDKVIADGAVAYWRLGETSGTIARSEVGSFDGTISGGVTLNQPGAIADGNKAMRFDGTSGKIVTVAGVSLPGTLTAEAWIKYAGIAQKDILSNRVPFVAPGWEIGTQNGVIYLADGTTAPIGGKAVNDNQWHHIVGVYDGVNRRAYVDGAIDLSTSSTFSWTGTVGPFGIGYDQFAGTWDGYIDDVAIYPTALSPAQISAHYALATANPSAPRRRRFRAHAV